MSALIVAWEPILLLIHYPAALGELQRGTSPGKGTSRGCWSPSPQPAHWLWDYELLWAGSLQLSPCLLTNIWKTSHLPWGTAARKSNLDNFCEAGNNASPHLSSADEACAVLTNSKAQMYFHLKHNYFVFHGSAKTSDESDIYVSSISVVEVQLFCGFTPRIRSSQQSKSKGTER